MIIYGLNRIFRHTIGIVGTLILTLYFSKRQIQALSNDTETRVLNDLGEKFHNMGMLLMEDPSIGRVIENINKYTNQKEVAFSFYVLWMCAYCLTTKQKNELAKNIGIIQTELDKARLVSERCFEILKEAWHSNNINVH